MNTESLALLIALIGFVVYILVGSGAITLARFGGCVAESGRIAFAVGLLAYLLTVK